MTQQHTTNARNETMTTKEAAQKFSAKCQEWGWTFSTRGQIVTVVKQFAPGDKEAYTTCDSEGYDLLSMCPLKGGSIWGTDGGSIGGMVGLNGGYYKLNKSGETGKRFLNALAKV